MPLSTPEKRREYARQWVAARRAAFFADKKCAYCNEDGSNFRLELDHIDASTKTHHSIWSWSQERQAAEIVKCQILCHPCHVKKTKEHKEHLYGEHAVGAVLKAKDVLEIRERHAKGALPKDLAKDFSVDRRTIYHIVAKSTWKWL